MNEMEMCSIYDVKAEAWLTPMFFLSRGQAVRSFTDAVNDAKSDFYKHPEDYTLFSIGRWNPGSGEVAVNVAPVELSKAINVHTGS